MIRPEISVIIPAFQAELYLAEALESVLAQTYPAAEIIVVDDGSSDGTAQVAARFAAARYIRQERGGIGSARNTGVAAARMEFLSFLDADDLWLENKLALQVDALNTASPMPDLIFGHVRQFLDPLLSPEMKARIQYPDQPVAGIFSGTILIRRETFARVGDFGAWRSGEFIDWYLRASELGLTTLVLPQVILLRRLHADNHGIRQREDRRELMRILKASLDRRRAAPPTAPNDESN